MTHPSIIRHTWKALMLLATFGLAGETIAETPVSLADLSQYFNSMRTLRAEFTQVNSDQTISTGTLLISRPGRARFDYAPPEKSRMIAGNGQIAIHDGKSNMRRPNIYPLNQTPLHIILQRHVDLTRQSMVSNHYSDGVKTIVVAHNPKHREEGSIELVFTAEPTELRQWVITDSGGERTSVILGEIETGMRLDKGLFYIEPHLKQRRP